MRNPSFAAILAVAVCFTTAGLWAQTTRPTSPSNMSGTVATPSNPLAAAPRQQIEGQLVDLFSISLASASANAANMGSASGLTTGSPDLRIQRDTSAQPSSANPAGFSGNPALNSSGVSYNPAANPNTPVTSHVGDSAGTYNRPGAVGPAGSSAGVSDIGSDGVSYNPAANPNTTVTSHVGDSAGTYNRPGAVGGSSNNSAGIAGNARLGTTDRGQPGAATPGTPSISPSSIPATFRIPAPDSVRTQLSAGTPAAILSGDRAYVLVADPKQFAQYAGQTIRINGTLTPQNFLIPDRLEVRQSTGTFQEVALNKPSDQTFPRTGTAQER